MPKTYKVTADMSKEIRIAMYNAKNSSAYKRMLAVALRGEGKSNDEAATITGLHKSYVSQLVSKYMNKGLSAILADQRMGGNNQNLSDADELKFLDNFRKRAEKGQLITITEMAKAYDQITGKVRESNSTVYYLLHKHGWRIIMPQTAHPKKASSQVIATSKKLTCDTKN